jgi:Protein of unknown function (DUF975)
MTYDPYDISNRDAEINEILQRPFTINIGQCLNRSTDLFNLRAGEFIGFAILDLIITIGLSNIPYVGDFISSLISGVVTSGYYFVAFRLMRRQNTEFGDFFLGFRNNQFWPILLVNLLIGIVVGGLSLVSVGLMFLGLYKPIVELLSKLPPEMEVPQFPDLEIPPALAALSLFLGFLILIPIYYFSVAYLLAPLLVVDRRFGAWQSMEISRKVINKQWWMWFGFWLLQGLIVLAGILACCIGVIFAMPVVACSMAAAYEQVIGLLQRNSLPEEGGFP